METKRASEGEGGRVRVLDGLRGVAILLVMVFHYWQITWLDVNRPLGLPRDLGPLHLDLYFLARTGYMGVELFFFLSGFCIAYPYLTEPTLPSAAEFFRRRAAKILPSLGLAVLAAGLLRHPDWPTEKLGFHLLTHALFIHNWFYETAYSFCGVLWSLAVEGQFYLLFPLLIGPFRRRPAVTALAMAAVAVAFRIGVQATTRGDGNLYTLRLSQMPAFLDLFAAGMLAAWVSGRARGATAREAQRRVWWATPLALAGAGVFLWLLLQLAYASPAPEGIQNWQAVYRLPFALTLLAGTIGAIFAARWLRALAANPLLTFFGTISYNLYLWHKLVSEWMLRHRFPAPARPDPHEDYRWQVTYFALAVLVSVAVASLATYAFERPLLRRARRHPGATPAGSSSATDPTAAVHG